MIRPVQARRAPPGADKAPAPFLPKEVKTVSRIPSDKMMVAAMNIMDHGRRNNSSLLDIAKGCWLAMYRLAYPVTATVEVTQKTTNLSNGERFKKEIQSDFNRDESKPEETPPGWEWIRDSEKACGWRLKRKRSPTPPVFNPATQGYQPVRQDDRPIPPPPGPVDKPKVNAEYVRRLLCESAEALELALKGECSQSNGAALVKELKAFTMANQPAPDETPPLPVEKRAETAEAVALKEQAAFERKFGHFNMQKSGRFDYLDPRTSQIRQVWLQAINWAFAACFDPKGDSRND